MSRLTWQLADLDGSPLAQLWDRIDASVSISLNAADGTGPQRTATITIPIEDDAVKMVYPLVTRLKAWLDDTIIFNGQVTVPSTGAVGQEIPGAPGGGGGNYPGLGSFTIPAVGPEAHLAAAFVYAMDSQFGVADTEIMARLMEHADQVSQYQSVIRGQVIEHNPRPKPVGATFNPHHHHRHRHHHGGGDNVQMSGGGPNAPSLGTVEFDWVQYGRKRDQIPGHGIIRGSLTPNGKQRDRAYPDGKNIWEAMVRLSEVNGGPDFEIEPLDVDEDMPGIHAALSTYRYGQGSDKTDSVVLEFGLGANNASDFSWQPDGSQVVNWYMAVGQAQKGKMAPAYVAQQSESMELFGVWQQVESFPDTTSVATLREKAEAHVGARAFPIDFFDVTPTVEIGGVAYGYRVRQGRAERLEGSFAVPPKFGPCPGCAYWIGDVIVARARIGGPPNAPAIDLAIPGRVTDATAHEIDDDGNIVWDLTCSPIFSHAGVGGYETLVSVRDSV